jgi:hypothetical protein
VLLLSCSAASNARPEGHAAACHKVKIGGHRQCLVAGHPCKPRYERQYERYGFRCRRNAAGQYRLWQPIKQGVPKP